MCLLDLFIKVGRCCCDGDFLCSGWRLLFGLRVAQTNTWPRSTRTRMVACQSRFKSFFLFHSIQQCIAGCNDGIRRLVGSVLSCWSFVWYSMWSEPYCCLQLAWSSSQGWRTQLTTRVQRTYAPTCFAGEQTLAAAGTWSPKLAWWSWSWWHWRGYGLSVIIEATLGNWWSDRSTLTCST